MCTPRLPKSADHWTLLCLHRHAQMFINAHTLTHIQHEDLDVRWRISSITRVLVVFLDCIYLHCYESLCCHFSKDVVVKDISKPINLKNLTTAPQKLSCCLFVQQTEISPIVFYTLNSFIVNSVRTQFYRHSVDTRGKSGFLFEDKLLKGWCSAAKWLIVYLTSGGVWVYVWVCV